MLITTQAKALGPRDPRTAARYIWQTMAPHPKLQKNTLASRLERLLQMGHGARQARWPNKPTEISASGMARWTGPTTNVNCIPDVRDLGITQLQHTNRLHRKQCIETNSEGIPELPQTTREGSCQYFNITSDCIPAVIQSHLPMGMTRRQSGQVVPEFDQSAASRHNQVGAGSIPSTL
jgi:hypothetical protein